MTFYEQEFREIIGECPAADDPQPQRRTGGYPAPALLGSAGDKDDLKSQLPKRRGAAHLG